jgi:hypothetical protein
MIIGKNIETQSYNRNGISQSSKRATDETSENL